MASPLYLVVFARGGILVSWALPVAWEGGCFGGPKIEHGLASIYSFFEGRMLIQGPEGFWGRGAYLAFDVPNLGI